MITVQFAAAWEKGASRPPTSRAGSTSTPRGGTGRGSPIDTPFKQVERTDGGGARSGQRPLREVSETEHRPPKKGASMNVSPGLYVPADRRLRECVRAGAAVRRLRCPQTCCRPTRTRTPTRASPADKDKQADDGKKPGDDGKKPSDGGKKTDGKKQPDGGRGFAPPDEEPAKDKDKDKDKDKADDKEQLRRP